MLACTVYTLVSQSRVLPKYRNALVMSSMVTFIAGYHYWRIFNSFGEASEGMAVNILYVLFVELGKSLERQPAGVAETVGRLRLLLIATWGVYPISYILNLGEQNSSAFVGVQVGYTIADILAKCVFGLTILKIARMKSHAEGMPADH